MAIRFHPLPTDVFPDEARPFIARLNLELRDLFGLEGTINDPRQTRRSDDTIARRESATVAVSRITPSVSSVVAGTSTSFATPTITYSTAYGAGSGTNAVRSNAVLLFPSSLMNPAGTFQIDFNASNTLVMGNASTTARLVLNGTFAGSDVVLANNTAFIANPTTNDQIGIYSRIFGAISDFTSPRVVTGGAIAAAPQFTFTTPKVGDVLGIEPTVLLQGGAAGGNFQGSLRGAYAHVDFSGVGNGITVDTVYGIRADIGLSSSGSGYTVTDAVCLYAGIPSAANIGTLTRAYSMYSEGPLAAGGSLTAPDVQLRKSTGVQMFLRDLAADPGSPVAGDIWRNAGTLKYRRAAATIDLTTQLMSTANNATLTLTDDGTDQTLTGTAPNAFGSVIIASAGVFQKIVFKSTDHYRFLNTDGSLFVLADGGVGANAIFSMTPLTNTSTSGSLAAFSISNALIWEPASGSITGRFGIEVNSDYRGRPANVAAKDFFAMHPIQHITAGGAENTVGNNAGDRVGGILVEFGNNFRIAAGNTLVNLYGMTIKQGTTTILGAVTNTANYHHPGWTIGDNKYCLKNDSTDTMFMGQDNAKTKWGTGSDAEMYYNGTNLIIDPDVVGTGVLDILGGIRCDSISNDTGLAHGTYTPVRSLEGNMDVNVTLTEAQYLRVGNTVTVSGRFTADPTTTGLTSSFEMTLPVASNLGALEDLSGVAFNSTGTPNQGAQIEARVVNDTALVRWVADDTSAQSWCYMFTYQVI